MTWDERFRMLEKGEIVQEGDEVDCSCGWSDAPKWRPAVHTIGTPAPDPKYPAHRRYRRLLEHTGEGGDG